MIKARAFEVAGGCLKRDLDRNFVCILGLYVQVRNDGRWTVGSDGVDPVDAYSQILECIEGDATRGQKANIARIYVNPLLGASLILSNKITFEKAHAVVSSQDGKELFFGLVLFGDIYVELVVVGTRDLDIKFQLTGSEIITTNAAGEILV